MKLKRIYLDYAASTPVASEVLKAMAPYWSEEFGNPGSLHSFGQRALAAVDKSRETVAKAIGADFREIIFTGSATESNNLALRGVVRGYRQFLRGTAVGLLQRQSAASSRSDGSDALIGDRARRSSESSRSKTGSIPKPKIIISSIEHESVLDTARDLEKNGVDVIYIPVSEKGIVDVQKIKEALDERTVLISVMYVNNEIGSVQPIKEISKLVRNSGGHTLLHTDAAQAFNYFDCDADKLGVDLMTLSGQKIYGPKGIGILYIRKSKQENLNPVITGGGQEFGLRSGTENVPAIVGFGKAVELVVKERAKNFKNVMALKKQFWRGLKDFYPQAEINPVRNSPPQGPSGARRAGEISNGVNGDSEAPHILNVYFPTEYAGDLLIKLDMAGVAVSAGSACSARSYAPSPVLQALGLSEERVRGSLRFSFGKTLGAGDIRTALKRIGGVIR